MIRNRSPFIRISLFTINSTDTFVAPVTDDSIHKLHDKVKKLKRARTLGARYMTFEELLKTRENAGKSLGKAEAKAEAILELLEDYGSVPVQLKDTIFSEKNPETLKKWHKLAARVTSLEEFMEKM